MRLKRALKRAVGAVPFLRPNPFAGEAQLLVHCSHHKAGTVWFLSVLRSVSSRYFLPLTNYTKGQVADLSPRRILFSGNSHLPPELIAGGQFRGSHIVRDLRDVVVSGYFYHLWTTEPWAHAPRENLGGLTYQEYLKSFDQAQGLIVEMERLSRSQAEVLRNWDFSNPNFLEIRYEDMIRDETSGFQQLFRHYGFTDRATDRCVELAAKHSFERKAKRRPGEKKEKSHLRSGKPGEWRELFSSDHKDRFKELMGPLLIRMGYERDMNW